MKFLKSLQVSSLILIQAEKPHVNSITYFWLLHLTYPRRPHIANLATIEIKLYNPLNVARTILQCVQLGLQFVA